MNTASVILGIASGMHISTAIRLYRQGKDFEALIHLGAACIIMAVFAWLTIAEARA